MCGLIRKNLDLEHDLKTLAPYNIAGMGITKKELEDWQKYNKIL